MIDPLTQKTAEILIPGKPYFLSVAVRKKQKGKIIDNPDYDELIVKSKNNSLILMEQSRRGIVLFTTRDTFPFANGEMYELNIRIKENFFRGTTVRWEVDWENFTTLDYSGIDGEEGEEGNNGNDPNVIELIKTKDGKRGGRGKDGGDGGSIHLEADYYVAEKLPLKNAKRMILIHNLTTKEWILMKEGKIIINVCGGRGGNGGRGGDGANGFDSKHSIFSSGSMDGGNGGDGGDGGDGGNGGRIKLSILKDSTVDQSLFPILFGGKGGLGGDGGREGRAGRKYRTTRSGHTYVIRGDEGRPGRAGRDGVDGYPGFFQISRVDRLESWEEN